MMRPIPTGLRSVTLWCALGAAVNLAALAANFYTDGSRVLAALNGIGFGVCARTWYKAWRA